MHKLKQWVIYTVLLNVFLIYNSGNIPQRAWFYEYTVHYNVLNRSYFEPVLEI